MIDHAVLDTGSKWETSGLQGCQYIAFYGYSERSQETEMEKNLAFWLKNNLQYKNPWHTYWGNARLSCCNELQIILVHVILLKPQPHTLPQCMGPVEMLRCSPSVHCYVLLWCMSRFILMEGVRGHCCMSLSSLLALGPCGGYIFLRRVEAKSTGHEFVGGSSKPHRHFVGTCTSVYCWWLKTSLLQLNVRGRQEKSLSAFAQKNDDVPAHGVYTETTFQTQEIRAWNIDPSFTPLSLAVFLITSTSE